MKTEEDEAFEAIERRQGGFHAKQNMAMHKTQDQHICRHYKQWQHCHICDLEAQVEELKAQLAQPAQEPHKYDWSMLEAAKESLREHMARIKELEAALAQPAQEPVAWNKNIRDRVDSLLEQAGYQPDSSARNALSMMNFATPPLPAQEPWNAALDEAASRIGEIKGFGQATQDSFAVFIKGLKK